MYPYTLRPSSSIQIGVGTLHYIMFKSLCAIRQGPPRYYIGVRKSKITYTLINYTGTYYTHNATIILYYYIYRNIIPYRNGRTT